jgi:hypothetical protein
LSYGTQKAVSFMPSGSNSRVREEFAEAHAGQLFDEIAQYIATVRAAYVDCGDSGRRL